MPTLRPLPRSTSSRKAPLVEREYESVPVYLKRYRVGKCEIQIHCRMDNEEIVQAWLYDDGILSDTILTIDKNKKSRLTDWFMQSAK